MEKKEQKKILIYIQDYERRMKKNISFEVYPYEASHSTIGLLFPDFARPPNNYEEVVRNRRKELSLELFKYVAREGGPDKILFSLPLRYAGKTLKELSIELNKPIDDILIELGAN